jgi:predicted O-linked N-acetylglucosamine transferase (SPINDLY family)
MSKHLQHFQAAKRLISKSISESNVQRTQELRLQAVEEMSRVLDGMKVTDYLLIDSKPRVEKDIYLDCNFTIGTLLKSYAETCLQGNAFSQEVKDMFIKSIQSFHNILKVQFEDEPATKQIVSVYTQLCFYTQRTNQQQCLQYLQEALYFAPNSETIHYNLGHIYQVMNRPEMSLIHYKLSIHLCKRPNKESLSKAERESNRQLILNSYNGMACVFRALKQWPDALYYLQRAERVDNQDPDIQNQLGVVYTEMRRTDLAEIAYQNAIKYHKRTFISNNSMFLLSEIYLNYGHMHSYNGNNTGAVDCYNKSLQVTPSFIMPFQNKVMNLSYLFDQLEDKAYILNQHKLVNKLYPKAKGLFQFGSDYYDGDKINIGIISGDFVDHPVSFFISTFLKNFDSSRFTVTCYSECLVDTSLFNPNLQFKFIKNKSAVEAARMIHTDKIHILFDLAGHTAFNRLDVFALKPSPIQITYIGYPYSTGLDEMDYRITDSICDDKTISQPFYTEKLLFLPNCFLCYDPTVIKRAPNGGVFDFHTPQLAEQPYLKNKKEYITIGCFNRVNKITDSVIALFNRILLEFPAVRFVFKTKALLNKRIKQEFIKKFDKRVHDRLSVLDCTILHEEHLLEYNQIDIAIDTFPYSGTTTSCEALFMGVPVFTVYDSQYYFHPQNVTSSILKNSDLDFYVADSHDDLVHKIKGLHDTTLHDAAFWKTLKPDTRSKFMNGKVCNKTVYMNSIQDMLVGLYESNKSA